MSEESLARAMAVAYRYASYAPRSEAEVRRRLARAECEEEDVEAALASLHRAALLDDARLAADWVESRARSKALGPIRLEAELKRKAIDEESIQAALASAGPGSVEERALAEATRWLKGASAADPEQRTRLAGRLQRLGYDWETIRQVLAALAANMVA
ncbi:MAG: regulatory protein RecX [Armatimonadetes bacterium]|nr:regulatory protein RecX [Armatimonadota bacterium]